ncbi:efflux RND transporter periplasmic adaptor subunit [Sulfurimonas sp. HSL-1716]|uniref:efflux RND transporter periplasmic adaptor subunit n=1 Tax=Hydrocurvibacter sulfurireducens TaxID=3131937 RepID=UPI0031FA4090
MKLFNRDMFKAVILSGIVLGSTLSAQDAKAAAAMPAPKVDVYIVKEAQDMPVSLEYPARISSVKNVTVTARISGVLEEKHYTEGASIHKGDLLYKIEPDVYQAAVNSAKATLDLESAKMQKAKKDWERADGLYKDKAISEQDKDTAYFAYQTAKASVDVAKAELQRVSVDLNYTEVKATIDGVAGMKLADIGDFVKEGTSLVKITQTNPVYAEFSIPDINAIKQRYDLQNGSWSNMQGAGLKASLTVEGKPYKKEGKINFIDTSVDASTSTLKARAVFENADAQLLAGQFVKIKIIGIVSKHVIAVPQKAVLQNPLGTVVFVVAGGKIAVKPVKVLDTVEQDFVVEGVKANDKVVVNNFFRIKPGENVVIDKTINR